MSHVRSNQKIYCMFSGANVVESVAKNKFYVIKAKLINGER